MRAFRGQPAGGGSGSARVSALNRCATARVRTHKYNKRNNLEPAPPLDATCLTHPPCLSGRLPLKRISGGVVKHGNAVKVYRSNGKGNDDDARPGANDRGAEALNLIYSPLLPLNKSLKPAPIP